jgi:hypothetical protein
LTTTLEPDVASRPHDETAPAPPAGSPPGRSAGRPFFDVFVAVLAAVALVAGFYVFGRAVDDDPARVAATDPSSGGGGTRGEPAVPGDDESGEADHHGAAAPVDDRGFAALDNGEQHGHEFTQPMTPEERRELGRQLTLAREFALQYPTAQDAIDAGWHRAGPFAPGLGSHHINPNPAAGLNTDGLMSDDDIRQPLALMYDGTDPDSPIAGLFYGAMTSEPPEGFAGPNDVWHKHKNICVVYRPGGGIDTPLGADRGDVTQEQCDAVGGNLLTTTPYLLHVWVIPGYESPEGVFAHLSSAIHCADGTYHTIGLDRQIGNVASVCADENE